MTSPHLNFFLALDNLPRLDASVLADRLGRDYRQFLQRRWIVPAGYLTHVMVPFLDSEQEVEVDVDEDAGRYSYCSPLNGRTVVQPLAGIALYSIQMDSWLADLSALIGIEDRRRSSNICRTPNHLWHLGELRLAGTHEFAPVFVGRAWSRAPQDKTSAVLSDAVWPRGGIILCPRRLDALLPLDHAIRGLDEFVRIVDGADAFDTNAFDRVLRGYVTNVGEAEPVQFFNGKRLKLPHMTSSIDLTEARAKIIKLMWGTEGSAQPVMSWKEVNGAVTVNTGVQSFDDAFGDKVAREEVIELVSRTNEGAKA
ncbi:hypothetical protein D8I35_08710 [Corticibacter populi]|uniref:Uncharacterized protein n=1 Tax=Corticibacter populi TaxID=1550736 RepID=A0A3M6QU89_9BURK|nr:hypothetical protein [Corticibacter populi]RMX06586.1 hypothetical protein D8I35_08710 [Corticibacter populi]RZS31845.1 hypothetical protein EV687_2521 [Corticibacter populi]